MPETACFITARFLTASRDDLFGVSRALLSAVTAAGLPRDPAAPLMIGVNGMLESGKKIIADAAVESLFDPGTAVMDGKRGYDEYWRGMRNGAEWGVNYIDMAYPYRADYSPLLCPQAGIRGMSNDMTTKFNDFCVRRALPGITFVQNAAGFNDRCGVTMYIENGAIHDMVGYKIPRLHLAPQSLRSAFNDIARHNSWARLVEIEIRDPRLLASAAFADQFITLAPYCRVPDGELSGMKKWNKRLHDMVFIDREIEPRGQRQTVNIFGRDGFPMAVQ